MNLKDMNRIVNRVMLSRAMGLRGHAGVQYERLLRPVPHRPHPSTIAADCEKLIAANDEGYEFLNPGGQL
jgi:hypothetical protein